MCGIIGYIGNETAVPVLIEGLKRLEYRGYDSAGIAVIDHFNRLLCCKSKGKVDELANKLSTDMQEATIGIAHTRWATHGEPSPVNAHPHLSTSGTLALIHNGIIENYKSLKVILSEKGVTFQSDTDTEVLVKLIEQISKEEQTDTLTAVRLALQRVIGSYAIALLDTAHPERIIVARKSSPLVIGLTDDACYFASDAMPLQVYTSQVIYPEDEEVVVIDRSQGVSIRRLDNQHVPYEVVQLQLMHTLAEKGDFAHFMLKEIFEQPETLRRGMSGRVFGDKVTLPGIAEHLDHFRQTRRILIVACGTSWHAALIGKNLIEQFCRIPVTVEYASEFRYNRPVVDPSDVVIALSQSGETADTMAAVHLAKAAGAFVYAICNVEGSSLTRQADACSYLNAGPEIGVASTKAFTGQVLLLLLFALQLAVERGQLTSDELFPILGELYRIPDKISVILEQNEQISRIARSFVYAHNCIYLGRGLNYPVALEGALKLKEISYIHAEDYPAAEMKHGPIALIVIYMPVIVTASPHYMYDKMVSNI